MDEQGTSSQQTRSSRSVLFTILGTVIVLILTGLYIWGVMYKPAYGSTAYADSAISTSSTAAGQKMYTIHLTIQPTVGLGPNAAWLGYQTDTPTPHPGTLFHLPKNALVTVIVRNFDSETAPRNPFFSFVHGTIGGVEYVNGTPLKLMNPNNMSHTFTVPDFGVSVPMLGVPSGAKSGSFETMKFSFRTPNRKGNFRWQCIVPCGWGLYGNGGPMSEVGYMGGIFTLT